MIILGLTNKGGNWTNGEGWSGSGYHRILLPIGTMKGVQAFASDKILEGSDIDVLLYNRVSQYDGHWDEIKKALDCTIVLDMDDYWYPDNTGMAKRIESNIANADLVTVTNQFLYDKVFEINPNVFIVENALPFGEGQFNDEKLPSDKIRIFWTGGLNHEPDLELLRNPIKRLAIYKDKIEMVIGNCTDRMLSSFTSGRTLPYRKLEVLPVTSYMDMYKEADIMLVPLQENEFNSGKSILKVLEAAAKRIPVIVSNVNPYKIFKDMPVLFVESQQDWFKLIHYLIINPKERERLGSELYEWAKSRYNLHDINITRYTAFYSLLNHKMLA